MKKIFSLSLSLILISLLVSCKEKQHITTIENAKLVSEYKENTTVDKMDVVTFGKYPQSTNSAKYKDPIEWLVLERKDDQALLLSKYVLDKHAYNNVDVISSLGNPYYVWENSSIRSWLNSSFRYDAFSEEERNNIINTNVDNTSPTINGEAWENGNNTNDYIFLLSVNECIKYFGNYNTDHTENKRLATMGTKYAGNDEFISKSKFSWKKNFEYNDNYYLRSIISRKKIKYTKGMWTDYEKEFWKKEGMSIAPTSVWLTGAATVRYNGSGSNDALTSEYGIRPAMWVKYK